MKQTITLRKNEAKILLYLTEAKNQQNTPTIMAAELRMSYPYCLQMLASLLALKYIRKEKPAVKTYYFLTKRAPIDEAKAIWGEYLEAKEGLK